MNKEKRSSIRNKILMPVLILGLVSIVSNIIAFVNIRNVNKNASVIADEYMYNIIELNTIQEKAQNIHKMALSHIIATDFDTMINVVDNIKSSEAELDAILAEYRNTLDESSLATYEELLANYDNLKRSGVSLIALSANSKTSEAYACANGDFSNYSNAMLSNIDTLTAETKTAADTARGDLALVYNNSIGTSIVTVVISTIAIIVAIYSVMRHVVFPITKTERELRVIIDDIDKRQGDLTKRVSILSNDEIAALAGGINAFMEKLQHIFKVIGNNSERMDSVVNEVLESVTTSNESVTDLSALTEELSATMQEVANNAQAINDNTEEVRVEVENIAAKSAEINEHSILMRGHADDMEKSALQNMETTGKKLSEILTVLNQAIDESRSVDQVNNLTNDILSISSQTNLLALNASIEAARAGEAGKGFAVVAEEIGQLANSSRETANHIQEINGVVTNAVHNLADHANNLANYMHDSIIPVFEEFVSSGNQYKNDASYIEDVMHDFTQKTEELKNVMGEIANSINTITAAISEGVNGVTGVADSTQVLVSDMDNISNRMTENQAIAGELKDETTIFEKL